MKTTVFYYSSADYEINRNSKYYVEIILKVYFIIVSGRKEAVGCMYRYNNIIVFSFGLETELTNKTVL